MRVCAQPTLLITEFVLGARHNSIRNIKRERGIRTGRKAGVLSTFLPQFRPLGKSRVVFLGTRPLLR